MTPKERAIAAFNFTEPDDIVPTFELVFLLTEDLLGKSHVSTEDIDKACSEQEKDRLIKQNADLYIEEAETLDYSIIALGQGPGRPEYLVPTIKYIKEQVGDKYLIGIHADGTLAIPNGTDMMKYVEDLVERPDETHTLLKGYIEGSIGYEKVLCDAGADVCIMTADYCFNAGPFLSPKMFREFVTPYLAMNCTALKEMGMYSIKHTDGDIMPILDQLVEAGPNALHSLDPQAKVDLKKVKELVGDKIVLCGNVHCGMLHNGTKEQVIEDSKRALRDGMPGGGFFFCTSNVPFEGMPLENYLTMLEIRKEYGRYDQK